MMEDAPGHLDKSRKEAPNCSWWVGNGTTEHFILIGIKWPFSSSSENQELLMSSHDGEWNLCNCGWSAYYAPPKVTVSIPDFHFPQRASYNAQESPIGKAGIGRNESYSQICCQAYLEGFLPRSLLQSSIPEACIARRNQFDQSLSRKWMPCVWLMRNTVESSPY